MKCYKLQNDSANEKQLNFHYEMHSNRKANAKAFYNIVEEKMVQLQELNA